MPFVNGEWVSTDGFVCSQIAEALVEASPRKDGREMTIVFCSDDNGRFSLQKHAGMRRISLGEFVVHLLNEELSKRGLPPVTLEEEKREYLEGYLIYVVQT